MKRNDPRRLTLRKAAALTALSLLLLVLAACPTVNGMYGEAYSLYVNRDESGALSLLDKIIEKDGSYVPAYVLKAAIYETRGDWNASEEILAAAQKTATPSSVVCFNLGNILFKKGEFRKAADEYTRALELDPALEAAYVNRANARLGLGEREAALKDYETFLGLTKKDYPNVKALVKLLRRELGKEP
ncbi:MAG: tetratricopeptide repeat protein [Spirochaetales bacterium]|nr:tetratricopeptide repeat protein [Spirochaetales bacterium]